MVGAVVAVRIASEINATTAVAAAVIIPVIRMIDLLVRFLP
jgi:hypothetical protein